MTKPLPTIDFGYPTEASGPFPSFNSIDEEAEWWDTHDAEGKLIDPEELAELARLDQLAEKLTTVCIPPPTLRIRTSLTIGSPHPFRVPTDSQR